MNMKIVCIIVICLNFLLIECVPNKKKTPVKNQRLVIQIKGDAFLIKSYGAPRESILPAGLQKRDALNTAMRRIESRIKKMDVRRIVEQVVSSRIEGASGAADYSSTGIAVSREIMSGIKSSNRNHGIQVVDGHVRKSADGRKKSLEIRLNLLEKGSIVSRTYDSDNNCEVQYRIEARHLVRLINTYKNQYNTEMYDKIDENEFLSVKRSPLSTFSLDVDTASYSNVRRFLHQGLLPPKGAVRLEEMINYFSYNYPGNKSNAPFSIVSEVAGCPWNSSNRLVHLAVQAKHIKKKSIPPRNLVLLLDVSGSMYSPNKLPLLIRSMKLLVKQLNRKDHVSIAVYAGAAGVVLPPTRGSEKGEIISALMRPGAGGSTNGGEGIRLAYRLALKNFVKGGVNRVILATDGDFNVGTTSQDELIELIEEKREHGIFLTVLGFGMGNYNDSTMEKLANRGNGNYAYIDTINEAYKVLVEEIGSTLITVAKDVKVQVEFNPRIVSSYRLIGYENRVLADKDFDDDTKDAGEVGAGHVVTVLYEIKPALRGKSAPDILLRYQDDRRRSEKADGDELLFVRVRYKKPDGNKSILLRIPVMNGNRRFNESSENLRFSSAVAGFGMLLRDSKYRGNASYSKIAAIARGALGKDRHGYRAGFIRLVRLAERLGSNH